MNEPTTVKRAYYNGSGAFDQRMEDEENVHIHRSEVSDFNRPGEGYMLIRDDIIVAAMQGAVVHVWGPKEFSIKGFVHDDPDFMRPGYHHFHREEWIIQS